jgi:hypothetical protein
LYLWEEKIAWKDNLFEVPIPEKNCEEWFDLLVIIIARTDIGDPKEILENTLEQLKRQEENIYNRNNLLLCCYLRLLSNLLHKYNVLGQDPTLKKLIPTFLDKTFSEKSRSLLYTILIVIDDKTVIDHMKHMLGSVLPAQECEVRSHYMGLRNLGATCYINSILQQFFMVEKFRYLLLNRQVPVDLKTVEVNGATIIDDFMFQLQKMYYHLQFSQKKFYLPREFCYAYKDYMGAPINTSIQEDSHEFLNRLVENIE